jgi:transcriptional regulator with XRE-family HTH domain
MDNEQRSKEFGAHIKRIRSEVFDESLRDFAKRVGLSSSYIGKLEAGEVGMPKRATVEEIASHIGMKPDNLLLKAGYVPDSATDGAGEEEYLSMLLATLSPEEREAVKAYVQHVKDYGIARVSR